MDLSQLSSNWAKLKATLPGSSPKETCEKSFSSSNHDRKRKYAQVKDNKRDKFTRESHRGKNLQRSLSTEMNDSKTDNNDTSLLSDVENNQKAEKHRSEETIDIDESVKDDVINAGLSQGIEVGKYVAIDCEMVGVGPAPNLNSALARVSIVDWEGQQVYDSYVQPVEKVTDWRTAVSGIAPQHMEEARSFARVQNDVAKILKDRIVVGHSLRNDFDALLLSHPKRDLRDTARHPDYRKLAGGSAPRLKILAQEFLGLRIQSGEHSSLEDARACMLLFRKDKAGFEREHAKQWPSRTGSHSAQVQIAADQSQQKSKKKSKKKKKKRTR